MNDAPTPVSEKAPLGPVLAVGLSFFVGNLDATVVNVATTQIGGEFNASTASVAWTVNGFVLAVAAILLFAGDLAGRFGARRLYIWGLVVFTAASVVAGLSTSILILIGARFLQGVGSALFQPAGLMLLAISYPDQVIRQRMIGLWAAMGASAAALGPMIGGFIVAGLGWRWIFWINLPIGLIAVWLSRQVLPSVTGQYRRVPLLGHLLFGIAVTGAAIALMQGPSDGWNTPVPVTGILLALLGMGVFIFWQSRSPLEVYPSRILKNRQFTLANTVGIFMNVGLFGGVFLISILLQQSMGSDPLTAGLQLLPMMVVFVIGNLGFSRFSGKIGARPAIIAGMLAAAIAVGLLALVISLSTSIAYIWLAVCLAIAHLGLGIASPAMTAAMMDSVESRDTGIAGAILNVNRQLGSLVGVAIAAALIVMNGTPQKAAPIMFVSTAVGYVIAVVAGFLLSSTPTTNPKEK